MTPKDDIAEFCGEASWDHHRKRQLKELGIDPEEINND